MDANSSAAPKDHRIKFITRWSHDWRESDKTQRYLSTSLRRVYETFSMRLQRVRSDCPAGLFGSVLLFQPREQRLKVLNHGGGVDVVFAGHGLQGFLPRL